MKKVGFILSKENMAFMETMREFGCDPIYIEDGTINGKSAWARECQNMEANDIMVVDRIAYLISDMGQLPMMLKLLFVKKIRLISLLDKIDTKGEMFITSASDIMRTIAEMPKHIIRMNQQTSVFKKPMKKPKEKRERIIFLYKKNYSANNIARMVGCTPSHVYRVIKKYNKAN